MIVYTESGIRDLDGLLAREPGDLIKIPESVRLKAGDVERLKALYRLVVLEETIDASFLSGLSESLLRLLVSNHRMVRLVHYPNSSYPSFFSFVCCYGHLEVAQWLWSLAFKEQRQQMLEAWGFQAFRLACSNGHTEVIQWLWDLKKPTFLRRLKGLLRLKSTQQRMLSVHNFNVFRESCNNDNLETAQLLWGLASKDQRRQMFKAENFYAFIWACGSGHLNVVRWLWGLATEKQRQQMLEADRFSAFRLACGSGHLKVAQWLWSSATEEQRQQMLEADHFGAFRWACGYERLKIAEWLYSVDTTSSHLNHVEKMSKKNPFFKTFLLSIIQDWPLQSHNYTQKLQVQQGYIVLRGLIRYADEIEKSYDKIKQLLQVPEILALVKRFITETEKNVCGAPNELLHLATKQDVGLLSLVRRCVPELRAYVAIELNANFFKRISEIDSVPIAGTYHKTGARLSFISSAQSHQWQGNEFKQFKDWLATTHIVSMQGEEHTGLSDSQLAEVNAVLEQNRYDQRKNIIDSHGGLYNLSLLAVKKHDINLGERISTHIREDVAAAIRFNPSVS